LGLLELGGNQLSGQFPIFWDDQCATDHLMFLAGTIPESLAKLGKLKVLSLRSNQLSGHFFTLFC